jgi:hypothetical protein
VLGVEVLGAGGGAEDLQRRMWKRRHRSAIVSRFVRTALCMVGFGGARGDRPYYPISVFMGQEIRTRLPRRLTASDCREWEG